MRQRTINAISNVSKIKNKKIIVAISLLLWGIYSLAIFAVIPEWDTKIGERDEAFVKQNIEDIKMIENESQYFSNNKTNIIFIQDSPYFWVDSETKEIDPGRGTAPVIKNGRTLIPIKAFIEVLGGTVSWNQNEQEIFIEYDGIELILINESLNVKLIEEDIVKELELDVPPQIINGRSMVPLRFVSEVLGFDVEWDNVTKEVTIKKSLSSN